MSPAEVSRFSGVRRGGIQPRLCHATSGRFASTPLSSRFVCGDGLTKCGNACADLSSDVNNCGGCGQACALPNATAHCAGATCQVASCLPGYRNCDAKAANGCEIHSDSDVFNCGACGTVCGPYSNATAQCNGGFCAIGACSQGQGDCDKWLTDGCETSLWTEQNCGACGNVCDLGWTCIHEVMGGGAFCGTVTGP
jgi:hypothetical protein